MAQSTSQPAYIVGCDVDKIRIITVNSRDNLTRAIPNQPKELAAFTATLDPTCLIICEATGGHEAALLAAAVSAKIPAHRADARKVKSFIRSFGTMGKTDAIDARGLTRYGQERHAELPRWQTPDNNREQLQALVLTRRDMVADRVAYTNRLAAPGSKWVKAYLEKLRDGMDAQIKAIEADIEAVIHNNEPLQTTVKTLRSVCGIGATTASALIALMPELGSLNRRQAAALAGLAPHPQQSGMKDAYRRTKGGRPEIRRVLFLAAMSAAKHHKTLRVFYERLIANGKKKLVALVGVMRKLVVICNAKLRPPSKIETFVALI
jgi:transposase